MGKNMVGYCTIVGENCTHFLYDHYKLIENDKIEEGTLLNATNNSLDPYDYHVEKCGFDSFKKLGHSLIHICWPGHGEDEDAISDEENAVAEGENEEDEDLIETSFTNGNNEVVEIFIQKCDICLERDSDYAFRQGGHQCSHEQF